MGKFLIARFPQFRSDVMILCIQLIPHQKAAFLHFLVSISSSQQVVGILHSDSFSYTRAPCSHACARAAKKRRENLAAACVYPHSLFSLSLSSPLASSSCAIATRLVIKIIKDKQKSVVNFCCTRLEFSVPNNGCSRINWSRHIWFLQVWGRKLEWKNLKIAQNGNQGFSLHCVCCNDGYLCLLWTEIRGMARRRIW